MNKFKLVSYIIPFSLMMFSCSEKKTETKQQTFIPVVEESVTPETLSLQTFTNSDSIIVNGIKYIYKFKFALSDSLPVITNSMNQKYYDNYVDLTIMRNNKTIFNKRFTKNTFKSIIPSKFFQTSALVGFNFNFNKMDKHDAFYFVASVGDPDPSSEMNFPIELTISPDFNVSYKEAVETQPTSTGLTIDPDTEGGV